MEKFREQLLTRREQMRKKREIEESKAGLKPSPNKPQQNPTPKQTPPPLMSRVKYCKVVISIDFDI